MNIGLTLTWNLHGNHTTLQFRGWCCERLGCQSKCLDQGKSIMRISIIDAKSCGLACGAHSGFIRGHIY